MMSAYGFIGLLQWGVFMVLRVVILGISAWALIDCASTPTRAFPSEGKQTKGMWLALTILAVALAFLSFPPLNLISVAFSLFILIIPGVYLADVRPAVKSWRRRRGSGNDSSGYNRREW